MSTVIHFVTCNPHGNIAVLRHEDDCDVWYTAHQFDEVIDLDGLQIDAGTYVLAQLHRVDRLQGLRFAGHGKLATAIEASIVFDRQLKTAESRQDLDNFLESAEYLWKSAQGELALAVEESAERGGQDDGD